MFPDQTFRHEIAFGDVRTAPGLMAKDALDAVGVAMDAEEQHGS